MGVHETATPARLANRIDVEFASERLGNYQYSQQCGSGLLDQLWVQ
jgi:hypothetical protein